MSTTLKILGLMLIAALAILAMSSGIVLWTLQQWPEPMLPTLYLGSGLFVLFMATGVAWFLVTQRELASGLGSEGVSAEERGLQRLVAITAAVLLGLLAVGTAATWNLDVVRAKMVSTKDTHVQLEAVLKDSSPIVKLAVCEEIFQRGWSFRSQHALIAALDAEPAVAAKCFQTANERQQKGVPSLAREISQGWSASLMRSQSPADACALAPWSPVMSELGGEQAAPRLLHCATSAASDGVRQCCAETLAQRGKLTDVLGAPADFDPAATPLLYAGLVSYAFRPLSLPAEQQTVVRTLGADDEAVRQWAVDLGCGQIDPTEAQPGILGGLIQLIETDSCELTNDEQVEYRAGAAWTRLCENINQSDAKKPVQERICEGVERSSVDKAIDVAKIRVWEAIRSPFLQKDAGFVQRGLNAAVAFETFNQDEEAAALEFEQRLASEELGISSNSTSTCTKLNVTGGGSLSTSTSCRRHRNDLTVGEYVRANKRKSMKEFFEQDLSNPWKHEKVQAAVKSKGAAGKRASAASKQRLREAMKKD